MTLWPKGAEEITGRHTQKDRRDRQEQEGECNRSRGREQRGEECPHFFFFGRPNPACASSSRPRLETTCFTKARPAATVRARFHHCELVPDAGCAQSGKAIDFVREATGFASVR